MQKNKKIEKLRSNLGTIVLLLFVAALFLFPSFKATLMQGLMKVGLFQPSVPTQTEQRDQQAAAFENASIYFMNPQGQRLSLADTKGKVVFINFWATWCPPCIAEMPTIAELNSEFSSNEDFVVMMVDVDNKREQAQAFLDKRNLNLPLYTPASAIPQSFLKGSIPTSIVLDKEGNLVFKKEGMGDFSNKKFKSFIAKLLDE